ncbi:MAG TPA: hypothetical protein VG755_03030 [Nannocystaceae bacterium]|nr:hypothetical protein [Nannocystaceae bacterium]
MALLGACDFMPQDESPLCVVEHSTKEPDDDLGGYSAELHAAQRSASFEMIDDAGVRTTLTMETVALGPVDVEREANCGDEASYTTPAEITLRSADGLVDLTLEATLIYDAIFGGGLSIAVDTMSLAHVDGRFDLAQHVGATDTIVAAELELSGYDGEGEIQWVTSDGRLLSAARLLVPWSATRVEL